MLQTSKQVQISDKKKADWHQTSHLQHCKLQERTLPTDF
jgi:hypothetical protein